MYWPKAIYINPLCFDIHCYVRKALSASYELQNKATHLYRLVISSSICCGITYLVFGVMNSNLSFSPVKPRMLLTEHTVLALDSDSLSKVQNIKYTLGEETEDEIGVNCQLNYTGIPDCRKKLL